MGYMYVFGIQIDVRQRKQAEKKENRSDLFADFAFSNDLNLNTLIALAQIRELLGTHVYYIVL